MLRNRRLLQYNEPFSREAETKIAAGIKLARTGGEAGIANFAPICYEEAP